MKKVTFLLGVLTSLNLGLINFLRDRSTDWIEAADRMMLAKAASLSFDDFEIRCIGEVTVGAFITTIE